MIPSNLAQLAVVAFFVEALIQTLKPIYDKTKGFNINSILSLVAGISLCLLTNTDIFKTVGFPIQEPFAFIGCILTGVLASRGSNVAHDVFKFIQGTSLPKDNGPVG
jgi:hypothetical protein